MKSNLVSTKATGIILIVLFWNTYILCAFLYSGYYPLYNLVSELGAQGTKTQHIFTTGMSAAAILSIVFFLQLIKNARKLKISIIPLLVLFTFSFSLLGAALFPLPLRLHGILGLPSILMPLSPLLALLLWRKHITNREKILSLISFIIMSAAFIAFFPQILSEFRGLKQLIFHTGWTIWFIGLLETQFSAKSS